MWIIAECFSIISAVGFWWLRSNRYLVLQSIKGKTMDILTQILSKYSTLIFTIIGAYAAIKIGLMVSAGGLRQALSRGIAFLLVVAVFVQLWNPFLNWLFIKSQSNMGDNLFAQSALQLAQDTISLVKNSEVSGEPLALDIEQKDFDSAVTEAETTVKNAASAANSAASATTTTNRSAAQTATQASVAKPAQSNVIVDAQQALQAVHSINQPVPTPTIPGGGQAYIDAFLAEQKKLNAAQQQSSDAQKALEAVNALGGGGPNKTYTVKSGDSLAKIAKANGATITQLCQINNIPNCNLIYRNMILVLP